MGVRPTSAVRRVSISNDVEDAPLEAAPWVAPRAVSRPRPGRLVFRLGILLAVIIQVYTFTLLGSASSAIQETSALTFGLTFTLGAFAILIFPGAVLMLLHSRK